MQEFLQGKYKRNYKVADGVELAEPSAGTTFPSTCLLYTSDAADE